MGLSAKVNNSDLLNPVAKPFYSCFVLFYVFSMSGRMCDISRDQRVMTRARGTRYSTVRRKGYMRDRKRGSTGTGLEDHGCSPRDHRHGSKESQDV